MVSMIDGMICCQAFLIPQVLMPNNVYNGQNRTRLVSRKTPETARAMVPIVPVMVLVRYNTVSNTATISRTTLSADPMFVFMICSFNKTKLCSSFALRRDFRHKHKRL